MTPGGATALVWFKRDLRVRDHAPLAEAQCFEQALALAVVEPAWLRSEACHARHLAFWLSCVQRLRDDLAALGLPLLVRVGDMPGVLESLRQEFAFTHLLSHEETGPGWSYDRDRAVARWCRDRAVTWRQWPQTGVVRGLRSRDDWAEKWERRMRSPEAARVRGFRAPAGARVDPLPRLSDLGGATSTTGVPAGGEREAWHTLEDFLGGRARGYRRAMSSPLTAAEGCSRLSAHLAFGTISMRCVYQATEATLRTTGDRELADALRGFAGRLRWHCHFMQKLEDEPQIERRNFSRAHDGLRPGDLTPYTPEDEDKFQAWCEGRTGYPMVDACMRQVCATGWLNFRMRAMLVSFAAYHLWLHWRRPGVFLARQFLDFEPGIHWSQMQMQSGTTGINTLRMYSPIKQARDHDPGGVYVRRWVPEIGTDAYPPPIVDEREALAAAKQRLYALRKTIAARSEAQAIHQRHGSRKPRPGPARTRGRPRRAGPSTADGSQGELF
jgi:deoxyribodipyrimidine photo-lyase